MNFMSSVLPTDIDKWELNKASMTASQLSIQPGGSVKCTINSTSLQYIPRAFQVLIRHNTEVNWKSPDVYVTLVINYTDGTTTTSIIPLNTAYLVSTNRMTDNVTIVKSGTFSSLDFIINNDLQESFTASLWQLNPGVDLDEATYNSVENMLPQLVYAYNTADINASAAVETQVIQLPIVTKSDTNLLVHATVTGTTTGDTISCTLKIDGTVVKSFPLVQTFSSGSFYFCAASLLPFIRAGTHLATLHITTTSATANVPKERALLVVDGKSILGGAGASYPHAEVTVEMLMAKLRKNFSTQVLITELDPDAHVFSTSIPLSMNNIATAIALEVVRRGDIIDFASLDGSAPPLTPYDSSVYYTDMYGMKSIGTATYNYTKEVKEDCTITTTVVDTTKFNPIYARTLTEEVNG